MKNKIWDKIDLKLWVILIIIICFRTFVYSNYSDFTTYYDTASYVDYDANIFKGEVDEFRTPVYPYLLKFIFMFSDDLGTNYRSVTLVQEVISIISVIILYMTLKKTFKNQIANCIGTIIYGSFPAIFTYNKVILTESLSTSLLVMYFCLIMRYLKEPSTKKIICIGLSTILLIMLRPTYIYILIALIIMFGLMYISKKIDAKHVMLSGVVLACVGAVVLGYCCLNKVQNGIFGISNVTQINQLDIVIEMGIYDTKNTQDEGIIDIIEQKLDGLMTTWYRNTTDKIMEEYTPVQIDAYLKRCIKNNFGNYISQTVGKIFEIASLDCDEIYLRPSTRNYIKPSTPFILIYIYLFFEVIYILVKSIKNKNIPLEQSMMLIFILGQFATIILGAQAEYSRLFITVLPIIIISVAWHIGEIIEISKAELKRSFKEDGEEY